MSIIKNALNIVSYLYDEKCGKKWVNRQNNNYNEHTFMIYQIHSFFKKLINSQ